MADTIPFNDFLDLTPPYVKLESKVLFNGNHSSIHQDFRPKLYCQNKHCNSHQFFDFVTNRSERAIRENCVNTIKLVFRCSNCKETVKTFFVRYSNFTFPVGNVEHVSFMVEKIGEYPKFGKPIPPQALKLIGSERDLFFKGNNCENMGLGIGAFSYYRRVIDAKKDKIFDQIIKVLELREGNEDLIAELNQAKQETQFTNAVDKIKKALPDSLNINGHNPLTLLYSALSEGLHSHTDEECLEYAHAIKVVLFELTTRLNDALKEDKVVVDALKLLVKKKAKA